MVKLQGGAGTVDSRPTPYTTTPAREIVMPSQYTVVQIDRFWSHVDRSGECWLWLLQKTPEGYGRVRVQGQGWFAHRFAYTVSRGEIPLGLTLDHLCRTPSCVRPSHLEAVPIGVNVLRGGTPAALNLAKIHCDNGHPFDEENTRRTSGDRHRVCRACRRDSTRRRYEVGSGQPANQPRVTHCPRGHEYTPENTYISKAGGRNCLVCNRERMRRQAAQR